MTTSSSTRVKPPRVFLKILTMGILPVFWNPAKELLRDKMKGKKK
jgi:hypothetical protein